ncbi:MAG TPA: methyl-accepting chemotaxis protein [Nevskiales bacterium]|nr:methyl-accepting chemotaxis protein [Nevskiales bacterium]
MADKTTSAAEAASSSRNLFVVLGGLALAVLGMLLVIAGSGAKPLLGFGIPPAVGYIAGGLCLVLVAVLAVSLNAQVKQIQSAAQLQTQRTQDAILRLLDEMSALADGDLTIETTVTEDVTGAIADSVNYTIEALRDVVATINKTSEQVARGTDESLATAQQLTRASQTQTQQILATTELIGKMVQSIQQVAGNAAQAAEVAQRSVQVAHNGSEAVKRTIQGMDSIREQIQETSKRIKRLGESSQEIGNIVELINDIAEQTNTLALNASIQAAMAGEAGRGFAVVADEVQRLAERSANATKQIEAIVRTIQADTNEAVISMEKSTAGVVSGARLAENAGQALDEIEQVSGQIARLVQDISNASRQQNAEAARVSQTMVSIREITEQTAQGTRATGEAISRLAQLAMQLKQSVAGFRLPE